ncbi:MAG: 4-alpha-glucanotransferase [Eubacteriales bacterium]|nr:4-alpha-glucanotransferase [Eubacteriales bacterium]MDD4323501.1 4-alpha-glucanotransferase [Eubacteriales bacterium]MDD4541171.1 4-alpha-glucanotransferase [Eubacteriales bacterium]
MPAQDEKYNYKEIRTDRKSGVLLHITSLPSPYGIGTMGAEARDFIDFLVQAGQSYWQILPIGPTGFGDSPYQSFSTRAGNPYLIDIDLLIQDGLLKEDEAKQFDFGSEPERVDFSLMWKNRLSLFHLAWKRLSEDNLRSLRLEFEEFIKEEGETWLHEYALFMSLKDAHGGIGWADWPDEFKLRDPVSLVKFSESHKEEIEFCEFMQFLFFRQWERLHVYARNAGIEIMGDLPIYVAGDSVEVWTQPELFQMDENLNPTFVSGTPPDDYSSGGQLWGSPLFKWEAHEADGFKWWIERVRFQMRFYDMLRLDHFRGFESYWAVPYGDATARRGQWVKGPADKLFNAIKDELGDLPLFAEDLGYMTKEVSAFRERTGFPSMKVLQFAFNPNDLSDYLPHNMVENAVLYTGTHDNDTIRGWIEEEASEEELEFAQQYLGLNEEEGFVWGMMRGAATTVAKTVIFQMQDLLELDNKARMNVPATLEGNWEWRMKDGVLSSDLAQKLRELTRISGRISTTKAMKVPASAS